LYAYVFGGWVGLIALSAWLVERYYRNALRNEDE
jgi:hypothetical protein